MNSLFQRIPECRGPHNAGYVKTEDTLFFLAETAIVEVKLNIHQSRCKEKKWKKHMVVAFIMTAVTLCYFTTHLFAVVAKSLSLRL